MKRFFLVTLAFGALALSACGVPDQPKEHGSAVILNTQKGRTEIIVDIVDKAPERTKGLMFKEALPAGSGMFFVFDGEDQLSFWMKNTLIPLDMIFFDKDYKVVEIVKNAVPCKKDPCKAYPSDRPAKYVLEVNAGTSDNIGLKEGDKAELSI